MKRMKKIRDIVNYLLSSRQYLDTYKIKFCNRFLRLHPKCEYAYFDRGAAYLAKDEYEQAIKDFNKALKLGPNKLFTYQLRANAYIAQRKFNKAIEDLNKIIQLSKKDSPTFNSNFLSALFRRVECYEELGKYDLAIKDLESLAKISKNKLSAVRYFVKLAELYTTCKVPKFRNGKKAIYCTKKAISVYNKLRKKDKHAKHQLFNLFNLLANAYSQAGKFREAIKSQKRAISLVKKYKEYKKVLKNYRYRLEFYKHSKPYLEE